MTSTPSIGMNSSLNLTGSDSAFINAKKISDGSVAESMLGQGGASIVDSVTGSETMHAMNRMVDSLVGPRDESDDEVTGYRHGKQAHEHPLFTVDLTYGVENPYKP